MKLTFDTERLILKVLDETSSELVLDYLIRNKEFLKEVEPTRDEEFYTIDYQAKVLKNDMNYIKSRNMVRLWIFNKSNLNKIIGEITFYNIVPYAFLGCHIGYKSDKDEIKKGKITEAIGKGIEIMFEEYGMHRIEAHVLPNNKASLKVLEKLGFVNEGIAYKFLEINGTWKDHIHLSYINEKL
jgi:[ribosomal protein S5]-alanine N-acetyltransferase